MHIYIPSLESIETAVLAMTSCIALASSMLRASPTMMLS